MDSENLSLEQQNFKKKVEQEVQTLGTEIDEFLLKRAFQKHFEFKKDWNEVVHEFLANQLSSDQLNKLKRLKTADDERQMDSRIDSRGQKVSFDDLEIPMKIEEKKNDKESLQDREIDMIDLSDMRSKRQEFSDYGEMPPCVEKSVIRILGLLSERNSVNSQNLTQEVLTLENQLSTERAGEKVMTKFDEFKKKVNDQSWKLATDELMQILKIIRPLCINEVIHLTEKASKAGEILKGKKVLLFIGATGAGKSTTIHYLCGSKFEDGELYGMTHLNPIEIKNSDLKAVTMSPQMKSETRYITAVSLDEEYVLCDTPGFEDTSGAEVDIANGIGVIKAIKQCKEVKPILLVGYKGIGSRYEGLKRLARTLTMMLPGFKENMKAMSYFFTKYPEKEQKTIEASLKNVKENLTPEEKADPAFVKFFDDIISKCRRKIDIKFIDPLDSRSEDVLLDLKEGQFIEYPSEKFQTYITQNSRATLDKQLVIHKASISEGVNRRDYKCVDFRLKELRSLGEAVEDESINQIYEDCITQITEQFNKEYTEVTEGFERQVSPQNELRKDDIQHLKKVIEHSENAKSLRENHLKGGAIQAGSYYQFLTKQTKVLGETFKKEFSNLSINFHQLQTILAKMKLISSEFKNQVDEFQDVLEFLESKIAGSLKGFNENITSKDVAYDIVAVQLTELNQLGELAYPYMKPFNYQDLVKRVIEAMEEKNLYLIEQLSSLHSLEESDLKAIADWCGKLTVAGQSFNKPEHPGREVKRISESLASEILKFAHSIEQEIKAQFSRQVSESDFVRIEKPFRALVFLKDIPKFSSKLHGIYYGTLQAMESELKDSKRNATDIINKIYSSNTRDDSENLKKYLNYLDTAKWVDEFALPKVCENVSSEIEEKVLSYAGSIEKSLKRLKELSSYESYKWFSEVLTLQEKLNALMPLGKKLNKLDAKLIIVLGEVTKISSSIMEDIGMEFAKTKLKYMKPNMLDAQKAEDAVNALDLIYEGTQSTEYKDTRKNLGDYLREYFSKIREYFKEFLDLNKSLNKKVEELSEHSMLVNENSLNSSPLKEPQDEIPSRFLEKDLNDIKERAKTLAKYIEELKSIETGCPHLRKNYLRGEAKEILNEILTIKDELSHEMTELFSQKSALNKIKFKLQIIQNLKALDDVIEGEKFIQLYKDASQRYDQALGEYQEEVINDFKSDDIEAAIDKMKELESTSPQRFARIKKFLADYVENLVGEVEDTLADWKPKDLSIQKARTLATGVRTVERCKTHIPPKYIPNLYKRIEECVETSKKKINSKIEQAVKGLDAFARFNNHSVVSEKLEHIGSLQTIFKDCITEEKMSFFDEQITQSRDTGLKILIKEYDETISLDEYAMRPPNKVFDLSGENPSLDQSQLLRVIYQKCQEGIKAAAQGSIDAASANFAKVEAALPYLPADLIPRIQGELKSVRAEVQMRSADFERRFTDIQTRKRVSGIHQLFMEYKKDNVKDATNKITKFAMQHISELISEFASNLEAWEGEIAFSKLRELLEYRILFASDKEFSGKISSINEGIFKTIEANFTTLINQLSKSFSGGVMLESGEGVQKKFECLIAFREFKNYFEGKKKADQANGGSLELEETWLPKDFETKQKNFLQTVSNFLTKKTQDFQDAINAKDSEDNNAAVSLANTIETLQKWNSFFIYLKQKGHFVDEKYQVNIQDLPTLDEIKIKLKKLINAKKTSVETASSMNVENSMLEGDRDRAFIQLNSTLIFLQNAAKIKLQLDIDADLVNQECLQILKDKLSQINNKAHKHLEVFLNEPHLYTDDAEKFNQCYQILLSFKKQIKIVLEQPNIEGFEPVIFGSLSKYQLSSSSTGSECKKFTENLKKVKFISNMIPYFKEKIDRWLDRIFEGIKTKSDGNQLISIIGGLLNIDELGQMIVSEHKIFEGFCLSVFNRKVQTQDIHYVLKNIRSDDKISKDKLLSRFNKYEEKYKKLVQDHLGTTIDYSLITTQLGAAIGRGISKDDEGELEWDSFISDKIPEILAFIFGIWTLSGSAHYLETSQDTEERDTYLLQPHPAQIISIFRIFSVGDEKWELQNNLIQIGTGEGKSLILAAVSCIFALLGYDVSCACYSEYLSRRDYNDFKSLFNILNVSNHIQYGTFNKLCENVINQDGDIRKTVESVVSEGPKSSHNQKANRPKILLIDEVDVFFKKDFYGNIYTPSGSLKDETITELIKYIWDNKNSPLSFANVKETQVFRNCCSKYNGWEKLIGETVKDMISDVKTFDSHDYIVQNDKIGYREQDGVSFNVNYGYKTLFAYFRKYENKNISQESLLENICIHLKCGHYSYAEMPKAFKFIMGVTGTLETLSPIEKKVIAEKYKITKYTYTPSVFGKNDFKFSKSDDILIEEESDYFNTIVKEISDRQVGKSGDLRARPVLVFFESEEKLVEFRDSKAFSSLKGSSRYLTEKASIQEKESFVKQATSAGQVSLLTRSFGRGTDFKCYDPKVEANGGVHVIQTFLSEEISEEVQIKGRTARQGGRGSYSLVLLDNRLEKFMITAEQIKAMIKRNGSFWNSLLGRNKSIYDYLNECRCEIYRTKYDDSSKFVEEAAKQHAEGLKFVKNLHDNKVELIKEFLLKVNKGIESTESRTICLMDATGSMANLLHKAKNTVGIMFERALEIMIKNHVANNFQMQFVVYRNYSDREDRILQVSTWEAQPQNLKAFMEKIGPEGGYGANEAVEIGLWHAFQEAQKNNISQIILIGDAPPNTIDEVKSKRDYLTNKYWETTKFKVPTHWKEQVQNLKGIPIHSFYVAKYAENAFNEIASMSGGQCKYLDVNSAGGADLLTDCVTETILKNVGDLVGKGDQLVNDYRSKYTKSFSG